jgi:hypothetical protein
MKAWERVADQLPSVPVGDDPPGRDARRADALVALASVRIAHDADPDRATVVVHVPVEVLTSPGARGDGGKDGLGDDGPGCGLEGGGVIHAETARRLACTARIETVVEDPAGRIVGLGRTSREPLAADAAGAATPGRRVPVPGVRNAPVHPRAPHPVVVRRGTDRPRQPGDGLLVSPHAGARARVEDQARPGRDRLVVPPERRALPGGAGDGAAAGVIRARRTPLARAGCRPERCPRPTRPRTRRRGPRR